MTYDYEAHKKLDALEEKIDRLELMLVLMAEANGMKFKRGPNDVRVSPSMSLVPIEKPKPTTTGFEWK